MHIVTIFIKDKNNKILIQKRSIIKNGKFGFTSGHVKDKEISIDGAIREIREELGIKVKKEELKIFYSTKINENIYDLYYLIKDINIKKLKLQKSEVEEVKMCTLDEIEDLIVKGKFFETQIEAFKIFKKYIKEDS